MSRSRTLKRSRELHPSESALVAVVSLHLCFLGWALGTMHVWSQLISVAFAATAFGIAMVARRAPSAKTAGARDTPWRSLLRLPLFWIGGALLLFIVVQALNPAWHYVREAGLWWLEPRDHVAWLPTSAATPFAQASPWRTLLLFASVGFLVCALWLGITRRRSIRIVLTILVANGALVALFGVIQRVAGNEKMFWVIEPPAKNFVATFLYKNHGGAYFNLLFAAACSLAWWYATRAERRLERTSPAPFFVFCAALIALIEVLSLSRAATLLMLAFLAVGAVAFVRQMARQRRLGNWPVLLLGGILTLAAIIGGARFLKADKAADRMQELFTRDRATSIEARQLTARATWEMALDRPVFGWGAGNYRFFFPLYQKRYPQILHPAWSPQSILLWEHAHNDYLEYLAELGVVGFLLLAAVPALWFRTLLRARPWRSPPLALLAFSIVLLLAHCWVDFNLQSPTILLTAAVIATLVARWSQLEIAQSART